MMPTVQPAASPAPSQPISPGRRPQAVLFDLDGTLVESLPDLAVAINRMLEEFGRPTYSEAAIGQWIGQGAERFVARALAGSDEGYDGGIDGELLGKALTTFRSHYLAACCVRSRLMPYAMETLESLHGMGIRLAVVTNKPIRPTLRIVEGFGFAHLVRSTIGGDSLPVKKPNPAPLEAAARELGVPLTADHVWLVGDSHTDLRAARAAGIVAIGVRGGYDQGAPLEASPDPAWRIVDNLRGVVELVRER